MNKIFLSLISGLVLIVAALLIVPGFIDWSQYREDIITQVEKNTGYKLTIDGPLYAGFLPSPYISMTSVSIDSAAAEGPFAFNGSVEKASVSLSLLPLLTGQIAVDNVTLVTPVLSVKEQTYSKKQASDDPSDAAENAENEESITVQIQNVRVENADISYTDLKGKTTAVQFPALSLQADDLTGPYDFDGRVIYQNFDLKISGETGAFSKTDPMAVSASIAGGGYDVTFAGVADMGKAAPEVQGEVTAFVSSIHGMMQSFGQAAPAIKDQSVTVKGMVQASNKQILLKDGVMTLGAMKDAPMPLNLSFDPAKGAGSISLQNLPGIGTLIANLKTGDALAVDGTIDLKDIKPLAVDGLGVVKGQVFTNEAIPHSVNGEFAITLGEAIRLRSRQMVLGAYDLKDLSLSLTKDDPAAFDLTIGNFDGGSLKASGPISMADPVRVALSHPNAFRLAKQFQKDMQDSPLLKRPLTLTGFVKNDGVLSVDDMDMTLGEMEVKGDISIDASGNVPSIRAVLAMGKVDTKALLGGAESPQQAQAQAGGAGDQPAQKSPWSRNAIDTSALRALNLDITANIAKIKHDPWVVNNAEVDIDLQNGILALNNIAGQMFDGTLTLSGQVAAQQADQPIAVTTTIKTEGINLSSLVKAATGQTKERVTGKGDLDLTLKTQGLSSSALIYALNGDGRITTGDMVVKGLDVKKVTEAISDESLTDVLAVVQGAFSNGQTAFQPIDYLITIREGVLTLENFLLEAETATLVVNGPVSFAAWVMDVTSMVDFTDPDDLPSIEMTLKGPLNAPQQTIANDVLQSYIKNKYGTKINDKVNKLIDSKLGDSPAKGIINNLLGRPQGEGEAAPSAADTGADTKKQPDLKDQLLQGIFGGQ